jgi:hypothetical protein
MRGKIIAALAATLLTITAGVIAQTSGMPSRPIFQTVTVRSATNPQLTVTGDSSTATNLAGARFNNSAGVRVGYIGDLSSADNDLYVGTDFAGADVNIDPGSGGNVIIGGSIVRSGASQRVARMTNTNVAGGCTVVSGVNIATCTRSTAGVYVITFSTAFSASPVCVASETGASAGWATVLGATTQADIIARNSSGVATDSQWMMICLGD